jgi:hypothetical protein
MAVEAVGRGVAIGDMDNDGDDDVIVSNNNGSLRLLLNRIGQRGHWVAVRLTGTRSNRDGIGARVALLRTGKPPLWRSAHRDGSYLSARDPRVRFGLGLNDDVDAVVVEWPAGGREIWRNVSIDQESTLVEGTGTPFEFTSP